MLGRTDEAAVATRSDRVPTDAARPLFLLVSAVVLGFAVDDRGKHYSSSSFLMLVIACLVTAVAALAPAPPRVSRRVAGALAVVAVLVVATLVGAQASSLVHSWDPLNLGVIAHFASPPTTRVVVALVLIVAAGLVRWAGLRALLVIAAGIAVLQLGVFVMRAPTSRVDVFMFERTSAQAVMRGENPYDAAVVKFRDLYHGHNYGPSLTNGSVLKFGYPYPPLSLVMVTVSNHWFHDPRKVEYACIAATVLVLFALGRSRRSALLAAGAAAVLVSSPRIWYVVRASYIEPQVVLVLAVTVLCATRWRRALPYALGVLIVSKQYAPLLLPLATLLVPWREMLKRSFLVPLLGTAAVCTVPALFARGFWHSVVAVQFLQPFRPDALSFAAWWANHGHGVPSTALLFAPAIVAIAACCRYAPRTASGFAASSALVLLMFFSFAKQAFPNYYLLVIGALCIATAAYTGEWDAHRSPRCMS